MIENELLQKKAEINEKAQKMKVINGIVQLNSNNPEDVEWFENDEDYDV